MLKKTGLIALSLLLMSSAHAAKVGKGEVEVPDIAKVAGKELKLNGAGERKQMGVKTMYVVGLYLPAPATKADDAINGKGAKRVAMLVQAPIPQKVISNLFYDAISKNTTPAEMPALKSRLEKMKVLMGEKIPNVGPGDVLNFDAIPGKGMSINFEGKGGKYSETISGDDFSRAILRIWLGDKPAEESLKQALLKGGA